MGVYIERILGAAVERGLKFSGGGLSFDFLRPSFPTKDDQHHKSLDTCRLMCLDGKCSLSLLYYLHTPTDLWPAAQRWAYHVEDGRVLGHVDPACLPGPLQRLLLSFAWLQPCLVLAPASLHPKTPLQGCLRLLAHEAGNLKPEARSTKFILTSCSATQLAANILCKQIVNQS